MDLPRLSLRQLQALEAQWQHKATAGVRPQEWGFAAYQVSDFLRLVAVATFHSPAQTFLDAGCGIGTKCLLAAAAFGLEAHGAERVPAYVAKARELGVTVHEVDLLTWDGYGGYGIIYLNHPLRDEGAQESFERWLEDQMAPGQILVKVNDCGPPPGWKTILDEREARRGVWAR